MEPLWTPDVPCDTRAAWVVEGGREPLRIEAAAWKGKPIWLRTIARWNKPDRDARATPRGYVGGSFFVAFVMAILIAFIVLARHNLRLGRGDTRGALRTAAVVFGLFTLADALLFRWVVDPGQIWSKIWRLPYLPGIIAWLSYLGIEPFLRRRWPHRLIAWTRLLEGRFDDPLVGREVLLGFLAGAGIALANSLPALLEKRLDLDTLSLVLPLARTADFWGLTVNALGDAFMKGLGSFAILLLLRLILRRDAAAWVGLALVWVLVSLPSWNLSVTQWVSLAVACAGATLAVRVGLVAIIVAAATSNVLMIPLTLDFSRWYAWRTGVIAALLLAIAVWGFKAAMGRRRILPAAMLEG